MLGLIRPLLLLVKKMHGTVTYAIMEKKYNGLPSDVNGVVNAAMSLLNVVPLARVPTAAPLIPPSKVINSEARHVDVQ